MDPFAFVYRPTDLHTPDKDSIIHDVLMTRCGDQGIYKILLQKERTPGEKLTQ